MNNEETIVMKPQNNNKAEQTEKVEATTAKKLKSKNLKMKRSLQMKRRQQKYLMLQLLRHLKMSNK